MSDETNYGFQPTQEVGKPSETIPTGQQEGGQPEYVTPSMLDERLNALSAKLSQSLPDKAVSLMDKRLAKWKNGLEQQGVTVTPQMLEQGRQELVISELHRLEDEDGAAKPVQQTSPSPFTPEAKAKVQARLAQLQADYGIELKPGTKVYNNLPWLNPDADDFLSEAEDIFKREAARQNEPKLPPNSARSPIPSGGANAGDLLSQYKNEVERMPTKAERLAVRNKYRELGLEI